MEEPEEDLPVVLVGEVVGLFVAGVLAVAAVSAVVVAALGLVVNL